MTEITEATPTTESQPSTPPTTEAATSEATRPSEDLSLESQIDRILDAEATTPDAPVTDDPKEAEGPPKADQAVAEDLSGYEFSKRIPEEALKEPAVLKFLKEQEDGVKKLVERNKERESELGQWGQVLEDLKKPETQEATLKRIISEAQEALGMIGQKEETPAEGPDWQALGYEDEDAYTVVETHIAKALERMGVPQIKKTVEQVESERQAAVRERQYQGWLKDTAPVVIKQIADSYNGFQVTPEQVDQALRLYPQFAKDNPAQAVKVHLTDQLVQHMVGAARKDAPKAPDMIQAGPNLDTINLTPGESSIEELVHKLPVS